MEELEEGDEFNKYDDKAATVRDQRRIFDLERKRKQREKKEKAAAEAQRTSPTKYK